MKTKLNLQLFADPVVPTAAQNTAASTMPTYLNTQTTLLTALSPEMQTFYDKTLIDIAGPNLVHGQFLQKRNIPKGNGKVIQFRKYEPLPKITTPLVEGITPNGQNLSVTAITSEIAQYGGYVTISDMLDMTAIDNNIVEALQLVGAQAGLTVDGIDRDRLLSGTNVTFVPKKSGDTETEVTSRDQLDKTARLSADAVLRITTKLRANNAKPFDDGKYVAIINPYAAYDIMRDPEWISAQKYSHPENIYNGEIGELYGVRFVQTSEAKIYKGADLASDSRNLKVNGAISSPSETVTFDGGTVEADALIGREVLIGSTYAKVLDNTATTLTLDREITAADDTTIYPGEGGAEGNAVFATLFLAQNSGGTTEIEGEGLKTFVKPLGSGGTSDPLNQRATVGFICNHTAEILVDAYVVRCESCSKYSDVVEGN